MFRMVDLIADRKLDAVTFTSAPAVAALMDAAGVTGRRDEVVAAFQADVVATCVGPVTAAAFELWGVPTIHPERSRLAAMVKLMETELPARRAGTALDVAGHQLLLHGDLVLLDGVRGQAVRGAARRAPGAGGEPRPRGLPRRPARRAARRAPPAPSTPSRWRSPGCVRRSAPGSCRPSSSAGYRLAVAGMTALVTVAHGTRFAPGNEVAARVTAQAATLLGVPGTASYVELCAPSFASVMAAATGPTVVVPLLLSTGYHLRVDLPAASALSRHETVLAPALGPHPLLAAAQASRLVAAGARRRPTRRARRRRLHRPGRRGRPDARGADCWRRPGPGPSRWPRCPAADAARPRSCARASPCRRTCSRPGTSPPAPATESLAAGAAVVADVIGAHEYVAQLVASRFRALALARAA